MLVVVMYIMGFDYRRNNKWYRRPKFAPFPSSIIKYVVVLVVLVMMTLVLLLHPATITIRVYG